MCCDPNLDREEAILSGSRNNYFRDDFATSMFIFISLNHKNVTFVKRIMLFFNFTPLYIPDS